MIDWLIGATFAYLATVGFAVLLNIPRRGLLVCGFVGALGWFSYLVIKDGLQLGTMMANLGAALVIGLASLAVARRFKMPSILFNIPSLVPLVPGGQAYKAVRAFAFAHDSLAVAELAQVAMIAGALAMGFFLTELVSRVSGLRR